jgi:hypothetical protein
MSTRKSNSKVLVFLVLTIFLINLAYATPNIQMDSYCNNVLLQANGTCPVRNFIINATIDSVNPLSSIIYTWNNTNYSIYDDSLVLYYNFDNRSSLGENDSLVKDISRYGNNGTISGEVNVTYNNSGKFNSALKFNGNIARVLAINVNTTFRNSAFTISFWVNPSQYLATNYFYSGTEGGGTRFYLRGNSASDGSLSLGLSDYNPSISTGYTINTWNHFIVTSNGTYANIYLNGNLIANSS